MTSNEALERYYSNLLYGNGGFQTDQEELKGLNAIKQDLERLEQLEKENQNLKEKCKRIIETSHDLNVSLKQYQKAFENFIDYLNEDKTKMIAKYSIKETFNKIFKEVL